ncbi:hypothetical protein J4219_00190 [Candidatus Woesearchaeota archaeon]|nr:hypothetical protein [Candidatus Woesearchaeota archaeon]
MKKNQKESAYNQIKEQLSALNERVKELPDSTKEYISDNPVSSTLVAFGIGVFAGVVVMKLLERK